MSTKKFRRELLRRLPPGYTIQNVRGGQTHAYLFDATGTVVRQPHGAPLLLPCSPGDTRALKNTLSLIRRSGVPVQ